MTNPPDEPSPDAAAERAERLQKIREAIEAGEYDTEEMMDKALRKFLQQNTDDGSD